ncbi:uncharacterized protein PAC_04391 [Phialocephala subalpina]|uniref:Uncharacterized protein n=1 Tax=Phialocephala subalpina TaxID=576137 RepID=A0A1L7WP18_9HELO|nr:uncharacterized protein PAC_04391 [Phialocephala subalpina]
MGQQSIAQNLGAVFMIPDFSPADLKQHHHLDLCQARRLEKQEYFNPGQRTGQSRWMPSNDTPLKLAQCYHLALREPNEVLQHDTDKEDQLNGRLHYHFWRIQAAQLSRKRKGLGPIDYTLNELGLRPPAKKFKIKNLRSLPLGFKIIHEGCLLTLTHNSFEDNTATEANITHKNNLIYDAEMEKVYACVNNLVKARAVEAVARAVVWAIDFGIQIDKVREPDEEAGTFSWLFIDFYNWGFAKDEIDLEETRLTASHIERLAEMMVTLDNAYPEAKDMPGGAGIKRTKNELRGNSMWILSGYCIGKGCGLESPDVLMSSTASSQFDEWGDWRSGPDFYTNLTEWWSIIFSIQSGWDFRKHGQEVVTTRIEDSPLWVGLIDLEIEKDTTLDLKFDDVLAPRWLNKGPWDKYKEFGTEATGGVPGTLRSFLTFEDGEENVLGALNGFLLSGRTILPEWQARIRDRWPEYDARRSARIEFLRWIMEGRRPGYHRRKE